MGAGAPGGEVYACDVAVPGMQAAPAPHPHTERPEVEQG